MQNTKIADKYFRLERANRILGYISPLSTPDSVDVHGWKLAYGDIRGPELPDFDDSSWEQLSEGYDAYGGRNTYFWIRGTVTVPLSFAGKPVRLYASTCPNNGWHETNPNFIVFIDGKTASAFDRNHRELTITECARGGETFCVALKGFTAMRGTARCSFAASLKTVDARVEKFCYDVRVPIDVSVQLPERDPARLRMEYLLDRAVNLLDITEPGSESFFESLEDAQKFMDEEFYGKFCAENPKVFTRVIGHTHLDVAWLWPMRQTREKTARTFANMLRYMEEYPEFKFMSSQPCIYNWVKNDYPELFERIREAVKSGRWEAEGGMWVEADCNLTSGEGFVRQFLYGKRFLKDEFDVDSRILWLPDVFGYSAALPQILKKCGIDYFMTTKISWNNYDRIPNDTFIWRGIDGSEVFSHFVCVADILQASRGEGISTYNGNLNASQMMGSVRRFLNGDICNETLASVGYGDGGGGTTREMIENGRRLAKNIPGAPGVYWGFALDYFKKWEKELKDNPFLAKWVGELYLEFHRGTLTSQADNKRNNRKSEFLYQLAETLCYTDKLLLGGDYPKEMFDKNWLCILTNQFHDILPGSSIREVYEDSAKDYAVVLCEGQNAVSGALEAIASNVRSDSDGVLCYNPTGISDRKDICVLDGEYSVFDEEGKLPSQTVGGKTEFITRGVPSKGWKRFGMTAAEANAPTGMRRGNTVENGFFRVSVDANGEITSLVEKKTGIELCAEGETMNRIVAYEDRPYNYDAWEVSPYYTEQAFLPETVSSEWICDGAVSTKLRTVKKLGDSTITQTFTVYADLPRIDVQCEVDWNSPHTFLRVHFPTSVRTDHATYDIQFGSIRRENNRNTSWQFAKFEVCGHKWADITDGGCGLAVLSESKYGWNCNGGELGLSLLRSPTDPDPLADRHIHSFTYSIFPHSGDFAAGGVVPQSYMLNCPVISAKVSANPSGALPECFSLVSADKANIVIGAVKRAEDDDSLVVRINEEHNSLTNTCLTFARPIASAELISLTEHESYGAVPFDGNRINLTVKPFEIITLKVKF